MTQHSGNQIEWQAATIYIQHLIPGVQWGRCLGTQLLHYVQDAILLPQQVPLRTVSARIQEG